MTPADIDRLAALHEAATPGRVWEYDADVQKIVSLRVDEYGSYVGDGDLAANNALPADAALIVAMRNALPELLAMARDTNKLAGLVRETAIGATSIVAERDSLAARVRDLEGTIGKARCALGGAGNEVDILSLASSTTSRVAKLEAAIKAHAVELVALGYREPGTPFDTHGLTMCVAYNSQTQQLEAHEVKP